MFDKSITRIDMKVYLPRVEELISNHVGLDYVDTCFCINLLKGSIRIGKKLFSSGCISNAY